MKTILGVYSASSVIPRVSPKVRSANEPSSPDRKRAVTCGECTIDKRFLVPKIYPGSIVKNSGSYRYRSGRRWEGGGGREVDYPVGRYRRTAAETGAFRANVREQPPRISRTDSFFLRSLVFPPFYPPPVSFSSQRTENFRCGCAR